MKPQACPNCGKLHDVAVYVTGQRVSCGCGIRFEVKRSDASTRRPSGSPEFPDPVGASAAELPSGSELPPSEATFISASARVELPGFELIEILGRGGMGEVWRARQRSLGREVAIKLLPPKLAKDPESIARFEKEATALAALSHAHIIQIIDRGMAGDHYYFAMEYVQGRSLRDLVNTGPTPARQALKLTLQICRAIEYAHDKHIIHRDLKPENILLDAVGQVKVADFGLAGFRNSDPRLHLTGTAVAMGTINYMSPEQRRDAKNVDGRADIYSLGVVLYELLTGELPIGRFKLPSEKVAQLDPRVDAIVTKMLETDPNARYARASELAAELEAVLGAISGEGPSSASAPGSRPPPGPAASSKPRQLMARGWRGLRVGLMLIGALATIALVLWLAFGPKGDSLPLAPALVGANGVEREHYREHGHTAAGKFPPNTRAALLTSARARESGGSAQIEVGFVPGEEELDAYAGSWRLENGKLAATQGGGETGGRKLIPRAYLAHRYFSTDSLTAEVQLTLRDLEADFPVEKNAQHFGELAFRSRNLQVSIIAIDDAVMRLLWRYEAKGIGEVSGNSADDVAKLIEDEMPTPPDGTPFTIKLTMQHHKNGTEVQGFVNGQRFTRKVLVGLNGRTGRIALGCRNQHCDFERLKVSGKTVAHQQPTKKFDDEPE